jgi:hypothetical protein
VADLLPVINEFKSGDVARSVAALILTATGHRLRQFTKDGQQTIVDVVVDAKKHQDYDLVVTVKEIPVTTLTQEEEHGQVADEGVPNALPLPKPKQVSLSELK